MPGVNRELPGHRWAMCKGPWLLAVMNAARLWFSSALQQNLEWLQASTSILLTCRGGLLHSGIGQSDYSDLSRLITDSFGFLSLAALPCQQRDARQWLLPKPALRLCWKVGSFKNAHLCSACRRGPSARGHFLTKGLNYNRKNGLLHTIDNPIASHFVTLSNSASSFNYRLIIKVCSQWSGAAGIRCLCTATGTPGQLVL